LFGKWSVSIPDIWFHLEIVYWSLPPIQCIHPKYIVLMFLTLLGSICNFKTKPDILDMCLHCVDWWQPLGRVCLFLSFQDISQNIVDMPVISLECLLYNRNVQQRRRSKHLLEDFHQISEK
jgi:hypothetical protein